MQSYSWKFVNGIVTERMRFSPATLPGLGKTKIPGLVNSWALARKGLQGRIKESDYTQSSRKKVTEIINHEMVQEEINSKCFYILID